MKNQLATMAVEMRPDERAVLKVGLVPGRHMAAIRQMNELTTGQTRAALTTRIAQLETAVNAAGGSVPTATGKTRRDMVNRIGKLQAALTDRGAVIPAAAVVKARTAKTTRPTTTTAAKVPTTTLTHAAAVKKAGIDSIMQARKAETEAKQAKEIEAARNLGPRIIEDEKRRAAFAPVAAAMDAAAVKPEPVAKAKPKDRKPETALDQRARKAYRKYAAMPAGKERTAFYKANRADILRGADLENNQ